MIAVASLAILIGMYWQDAKRAIGSRSFDVPISEAVEHYARTVPHSYRDGINLHAFEVLHKAMCAGKLPVVGISGEDASSEKVSARTCKRFKPRMVVVPHNWATPLGIRFDVMEETEPIEPLVESDRFHGYTSLRVCGEDLYRLWPRASSGNG